MRKISRRTYATAIQVRVILLYARSRCVPVWCKLRPPTGASGGGGAARTGLRIDALYVHESPQPGVNRPQEVYAGVEELVDSMAAGAGHAAYIFEAGGGNVKKALAHTVSTVVISPCELEAYTIT